MDARSVVTVSESDLAAGSGSSSPASVRRIAKAAKDMAIAHYASHISRLRRYSFLQIMYMKIVMLVWYVDLRMNASFIWCCKSRLLACAVIDMDRSWAL